MLSELYSLTLKLYSKQYNTKFVLHLIVVPQLSSGWQHNYSTKTRQAAGPMSSLCILLCLRWHNTDGIISICVVSPKVAKASTVPCRWHWRFCTKLCQWKYSFKVGLNCGNYRSNLVHFESRKNIFYV